MEKNDLIKILENVCRDTFEDQSLIIEEATSAKDIKKWDSLNHVILISAIEKKFDIKFDLDDMLSFENIGAICNNIYDKIK